MWKIKLNSNFYRNISVESATNAMNRYTSPLLIYRFAFYFPDSFIFGTKMNKILKPQEIIILEDTVRKSTDTKYCFTWSSFKVHKFVHHIFLGVLKSNFYIFVSRIMLSKKLENCLGKKNSWMLHFCVIITHSEHIE
jgi:hypothetical protein